MTPAVLGGLVHLEHHPRGCQVVAHVDVVDARVDGGLQDRRPEPVEGPDAVDDDICTVEHTAQGLRGGRVDGHTSDSGAVEGGCGTGCVVTAEVGDHDLVDAVRGRQRPHGDTADPATPAQHHDPTHGSTVTPGPAGTFVQAGRAGTGTRS